MKYLSFYFLLSFLLINISILSAQSSNSLTQEERNRWFQGQHVQKAFGIIDTIDYSKINPKRTVKTQPGAKAITREQAASWGKSLPNETKRKPISQKEKILKQKAKGVREAFGIEY